MNMKTDKKQYTPPTIEVIDIDPRSIIATSLPVNNNPLDDPNRIW